MSERHQIVSEDIANVQVNNPVHEVEADKTHGENDTRVFIDVWWWHAEQFIGILGAERFQLGAGHRWLRQRASGGRRLLEMWWMWELRMLWKLGRTGTATVAGRLQRLFAKVSWIVKLHAHILERRQDG